jgi:AcrR family transcriptional regulator
VTPTSAGPRRRGRPRSTASASGLDPREEILRHAAALFSAQGLGATRLRDIAASVGVSPPALYYHFDNIEAIVEELLTYVVEESAAYATAAARGQGTAVDRLRLLLEQHVARLTAGPYDLWFVAGMSDVERARFPAVSRQATRCPAVSRQATRWRRSVARLVREGVDRGELRAVDPVLAVATMSGLVYGALELRHRGAVVHAGDVAELAARSLSLRPG